MPDSKEDAYSLSKLQKNGLTLRIPLYQRPYSWGVPQVKQLIDDLKESAQNRGSQKYYVGLLSVAKTEKENILDLIDGQQRITTLVRLYQTAGGTFTKAPLSFYGREADQYCLEKGVKPKECKGFNTLLETNFSGVVSELEGLQDFIFNNVVFFIARVPESYGAKEKNLHFVRMNHRGKQLEKHEILKVRLLGSESDPAYLRTWNDMVQTLGGLDADDGANERTLEDALNSTDEEKGGAPSGERLYFPIVDIPEFLLITLARTENKKSDGTGFFNKDRLLETFDRGADIGAFFEKLKVHLDLLKTYLLFIRKGEQPNLGIPRDSVNKNSEVSQIEFEEGKKTVQLDQLMTIQSFLHYSSSQAHHWLIKTFDWLENKTRNENKNITANEFIAELELIDNANVNELKRARNFDDPEDWKYPNVQHYWFYRLDYELWKIYKLKGGEWCGKDLFEVVKNDGGAKELLDKYRFRRLGSVEHIDPQTDITGKETINIDQFNNLALISQELNSTLYNRGRTDKKAIVESRAHLESIKMLLVLWGGKGGEEDMLSILQRNVEAAS